MPKSEKSTVAQRRVARALASTDAIDPDRYTREQLLQMIQSRADYRLDHASALLRMNKSALAIQVRAPLPELAAAAATEEEESKQEVASVAPSQVSLCASDQVGTTRQLRRLAQERGIANASTLTKKQLCVALSGIQDAKDEDVDLPAGYLDLVSQEAMGDPVVASDGYSYDYTSLRNLFLSAMQTFEDRGRPRSAAYQPRVVSLRDPSIVLSNPFPDIPGWPASFPLIRNHDLRHSIAEWRLKHGLAPFEAAVVVPVVHMRRDIASDGFSNGIFYGEPASVSSQPFPHANSQQVTNRAPTVMRYQAPIPTTDPIPRNSSLESYERRLYDSIGYMGHVTPVATAATGNRGLGNDHRPEIHQIQQSAVTTATSVMPETATLASTASVSLQAATTTVPRIEDNSEWMATIRRAYANLASPLTFRMQLQLENLNIHLSCLAIEDIGIRPFVGTRSLANRKFEAITYRVFKLVGANPNVQLSELNFDQIRGVLLEYATAKRFAVLVRLARHSLLISRIANTTLDVSNAQHAIRNVLRTTEQIRDEETKARTTGFDLIERNDKGEATNMDAFKSFILRRLGASLTLDRRISATLWNYFSCIANYNDLTREVTRVIIMRQPDTFDVYTFERTRTVVDSISTEAIYVEWRRNEFNLKPIDKTHNTPNLNVIAVRCLLAVYGLATNHPFIYRDGKQLRIASVFELTSDARTYIEQSTWNVFSELRSMIVKAVARAAAYRACLISADDLRKAQSIV
jgi:hypothetical protein